MLEVGQEEQLKNIERQRQLLCSEGENEKWNKSRRSKSWKGKRSWETCRHGI